MSDILTREIIRRIMLNVGVAPPPVFGTGGITTPELKLDDTLSGVYSDGQKFEFPLWAGTLDLEKSKVRVIVADITDEVPEYAMLVQLDTMPIHGLRHIFDEEDNGILLISGAQGWVTTGMYLKARALSGMELIASYGLPWTRCNDSKNLVSVLSTLIYF